MQSQPMTGSNECFICRVSNAWSHKDCPECPSYQKNHYTLSKGGEIGNTDFFCVAESPHLSSLVHKENHSGWVFQIERSIFTFFTFAGNKYDTPIGRFTYAVKCQEEKPSAAEIKSCAPNLVDEILLYSNPNNPICVFVMGATGLKSLGIQFGKYTDVISKTIETTIGGRPAYVFVSMSKRQLSTKAGFSQVLERQIEVFLDMVKKNKEGKLEERRTALSRLSKDYKYPKNIQELAELTDEILNYSVIDESKESSPLAIDTETNTLYPHRQKLKVLIVSLCWDVGKAASIQLEHPESNIKLKDAQPYLERIFSCNKPKIFANAKFDIKVLRRRGFEVNRLAWDAMLGEHLVEEDKKGFYGLKSLARLRLPEFASYEDELKAIYAGRVDTEDLTITDSIYETAEKQLLKKPKIAKKKKKKKEEGDEEEYKPSRLEKKLAADDGYATIPLRELLVYAAFDADVTFRSAMQQRKELTDECNALHNKRRAYQQANTAKAHKIGEALCRIPNPPLYNMAKRILPTTQVLAKMEMTGIKVDREYIIKLKTEMDSYIASSESLFADMIPVGLENFNPASTQHVAKVLFSTGYINPEDQQVICYAGKIEPEKTDKGAISTGAKFLKLLALTHKCKFSEAVLEFRAISKARTTFVENIEVLSREDGRLHSNFHQHSTATARLSSTEENMQNLPTKMGRPPFQYNIKRIFIPSYEDYVFVNTDAKAAEVRIYAAYSKDKALIAALNDGMDPHSFFASTVYNAANVLQGIPKHLHRNVLTTIGIDEHHAWNYEDFEARDTLKKTDKVYGSQLDALRKNIKRVVFGILYGAAPKKISGIVGIPEEQADAIIRTLFNMFPSIKDYINITKEQVRRMGIVETFLGRRRHLNLGNLPDYLKSRAERQAVNFKIQNTSAELVLEVLCATFPVIHHDFNGNVLNTVHDSLVFEIPKKYVHQMPDFINDYGMKQIAKKYPWLPVPFTWDVSVGPTYGDLMSVESYLSNNPEIQSDEDDYIDLEIRNELYDEATLGMHRQAS